MSLAAPDYFAAGEFLAAAGLLSGFVLLELAGFSFLTF